MKRNSNKVYLIERPRGVLLTSGVNTIEAANFLDISVHTLPTCNHSITLENGTYIEAFNIEESEAR